MKILSTFFLMFASQGMAALVEIPFSPFQIDCPDGWQQVTGHYTAHREYDPNKGIESDKSHIHLQLKPARTIEDAIQMTSLRYRKIAQENGKIMPFLWSQASFETDSGLRGVMAVFGSGERPGSEIKEKKFYFASTSGAIYCVCLETRDSSEWPKIEAILKKTLVELPLASSK